MIIKDETFEVICRSIDETMNIITKIGETQEANDDDVDRMMFNLLTANNLLKLEKINKMKQTDESIIMKLVN